jgi:hypothetical protein
MFCGGKKDEKKGLVKSCPKGKEKRRPIRFPKNLLGK